MKPLLFLIACFLIICSVQGVTLSPLVKYEGTMAAGTSTTFEIAMQSATGESIDSTTVTGDCAGWITLDSYDGFDLPSTVKATVTVPATATNGNHVCEIDFLIVGTGQVRAAIGFPVRIQATGGTEPTPTTAPTTPTTQAPLTTTAAPTAEPTQAPAPAATPTPADEGFGILALVIIAAGTLVVVSFIAIVVYDIRRERR